jgi:DNA-binding response OmpR family regulator
VKGRERRFDGFWHNSQSYDMSRKENEIPHSESGYCKHGWDRMKVLVIDDNSAFRHSLAGALGKGGYQVVMADDGEHGLAVFRKECPDLVICDLIMPRRNGVDTIQQIRRESPTMKIIAISGSSLSMNVDGLATALESGADDVIVKPFDSEDLLSRVSQVLGV